MVSTFQTLSKKSRLAKHWVGNLIYSVFLMMVYIRAEQEGEIGLHLYFFAVGHWNCAQDGIVYLRSMKKMPDDNLLNKFMDRENVIRIKEGFFNAI